MKITKITAKNYRVLSDAVIPLGQHYCAISGKNNAGKSCVIGLLSSLLHQRMLQPWRTNESEIDYKEDKTQWIKDEDSIVIEFDISLNRNDDASLVTFVEKLAGHSSNEANFLLRVLSKYNSDGTSEHSVDVANTKIDGSLAKDVLQKLKT